MKTQSHTLSKVECDPRWQAIVRRDKAADDTFFYSVRTTGVYCRPSCAARLANPKNVAFHSSYSEAEQAGFRACKRCKPDQAPLRVQQIDRITTICRLIENSDQLPKLDELARQAGMSKYHFHRLFRQHTGLTPKAYGAYKRAQRIHNTLKESGSVTAAIFDAGFSSNSRFYEQSEALLGMSPSEFRRGGAANELKFAIGDCSLGAILVASSSVGVCAIFLGDCRQELEDELKRRFPSAVLLGGDPEFEKLVAIVVSFVERPSTGLPLPLDIRGTAFQQRVWKALRDIPAGKTVSYAEIAAQLGEPKSTRAVARACGANPIAVAIPCHRVVKSDGQISGYRWGVERKRRLLEKEGAG